MGSLPRAAAVTPVPVHGKNQPSRRNHCPGFGSLGQRVGYKGSSSQQCAGVLQEVTSIHVLSVGALLSARLQPSFPQNSLLHCPVGRNCLLSIAFGEKCWLRVIALRPLSALRSLCSRDKLCPRHGSRARWPRAPRDSPGPCIVSRCSNRPRRPWWKTLCPESPTLWSGEAQPADSCATLLPTRTMFFPAA